MARPARDPRTSGASEAQGALDGVLVVRVLDGDVEAFGELVRRHQDGFYRYARSMRIDHDPACDLVQDAFVAAFDMLAECRRPERFRFWALRILRNRCLDWLKNIRRRSVPIEDVTLESSRPEPSADVHRLELRAAIESALEKLPADLSEAFMMKHGEGMSYAEMARVADASISAMKMRVHRARETLRDLLRGAEEAAAG